MARRKMPMRYAECCTNGRKGAETVRQQELSDGRGLQEGACLVVWGRSVNTPTESHTRLFGILESPDASLDQARQKALGYRNFKIILQVE